MPLILCIVIITVIILHSKGVPPDFLVRLAQERKVVK